MGRLWKSHILIFGLLVTSKKGSTFSLQEKRGWEIGSVAVTLWIIQMPHTTGNECQSKDNHLPIRKKEKKKKEDCLIWIL